MKLTINELEKENKKLKQVILEKNIDLQESYDLIFELKTQLSDLRKELKREVI